MPSFAPSSLYGSSPFAPIRSFSRLRVRYRKVKQLVSGHTATVRPSKGLNPEFSHGTGSPETGRTLQVLTERLGCKHSFHDVRRKEESESPVGKVDPGRSQPLVLGQCDLRVQSRLPAWVARAREMASAFRRWCPVC